MNTIRLKSRDYWIYPQPITPGQFRITGLRLTPRREITGRTANRFAWKIRNYFLGAEPFDTWASYKTEFCNCEFVCREPGREGCSYER
jgi:hypothetical protein